MLETIWMSFLKFIDDFAKEVNLSLTKATYVSQKLSDDFTQRC